MKENGQVTVMAESFQFYLAIHGESLKNFGQQDNAEGVNEKKWENDSQLRARWLKPTPNPITHLII